MLVQLKRLVEWGCDISGALPRFVGDEEFMLECIEQVSTDPAFEALGESIAKGEVANAFDAAHTLKGILANTGLTPLYEIIVRIVEPLRAGKISGLEPIYADLINNREQLKQLLQK